MGHDGKVTISTALDNKGLEKGIKGVSGSLGGLSKVVGGLALSITAALGAAAVSITKQATEAYADYEQLTGGMETMFKKSASKIAKYAEDAFFTAGVSKNEYMDIVTSFSASLISFLAGDTEAAADVANIALIDISDNANKMGSTLSSVQEAYKGFSKQQYQLLDNLKLGYGGTKTEMERLLRDAEAYSGVKYDINNLSDVYNAIHKIQEKLGIAGATAQEAEKTITGSANMTKAAWKNVLVAISSGGDIDKAINNLVFSVSKYFNNIVPVVQRSLTGIGQLIEKIAPQLVQTVASSLIQAIPSLLNAVYQMIIGLAKGIYQGIVALFTGKSFSGEISASLNQVSSGFASAAAGADNLAESTEAAGKAAKKSLAGFDELNVLQNNVGGSAGGGIAGGAIDIPVDAGAFDAILEGTENKVGGFVEILKSKFAELQKVFAPSIEAGKELFAQMRDGFNASLPSFTSGFESIKGGLRSIWDYLSGEFIPNVANSFNTSILPIFGDVWCLYIQELGYNFLLMGELFNSTINDILIPAGQNLESCYIDVFENIKLAWDEHGNELLTNIETFFAGARADIDEFYKDVILPIWEKLKTVFKQVWTDGLEPLTQDIADFVLEVGNCLLSLYNEFIKPIVDWLQETIYPIIVNVIDLIIGNVGGAYTAISNHISGIIRTIKGIVQFVSGVFTGDWRKAWEGVKNIFGGIWESLKTVIKAPLNAIIAGINILLSGITTGVNTAIKAINKLSFTVPDWVPGIGGETWGFNIKELTAPQIPKLAQGAVLPPNKPFMAIVGDQKHGTNIEAPLSTIQEAVAAVMQEYISANMAGHEATVSVLQEILEAVLGIQIGDDVIASAVNRYNRKMAVMRGG